MSLDPRKYRDVPIFEGLTDDEIRRMLEGSERVEVAESAPVFQEGELADCFYILESGEVIVQKAVEGGRKVDLATLFPKAPLGEMGLVSNRPRCATVIASKASAFRRVARHTFVSLCDEGSPAATKVALNIARILRERLDALNQAFGRLVEQARPQPNQVPDPLEHTEDLVRFREQLYKEWVF